MSLPARRLLPYATVCAVVTATFARCLSAAPIWDDEYLTTRNPHLASWKGVWLLLTTDIWSSSVLQERSGYYRPVAALSYALNRLLTGNSSASYHAWNVALHAAVAVLLMHFILSRRIARVARSLPVVLLFATMPLVAEPVSWIAGRYDLVGALFTLVALAANRGRSRRWASPLAFACAILSKEPYAVGAGLVVLDDVMTLRRGPLAETPKYAGLASVAALSFFLRHLADVPPATRLLQQGGPMVLLRAYAFAWQKLGALAVHPVDLCFFHTYVEPGALTTVLVSLAVAMVIAWAVWSWRRSPTQVSRGGIALGVIWCAVAMLPGALTAPTLRIIGDRYAYFPLLGASIALAAVLERMATRSPLLRLAPLVILTLAALQVGRLESRLDELQSPDAMFAATLARDPDNFTTLSLWGNTLARRGDYERAEVVFEHGRRVAPLTGDFDTGLAFVHLREHRYALAEDDSRRAVSANPNNPRSWLNLASALVDQRKSEEALRAADTALRVRPHYAEAHYVRAIALVQLGRLEEARTDLRSALEIDPTHAAARELLTRLDASQARPR